MTDPIIEKYRSAPERPGVYLMKNAKGDILYIGKAANLKKRLTSYFVNKNHDPKTSALLEMVKDFDVLITSSDHEAFILESNMIKAHAPKYNVILKDGKNYPLLRIDISAPYPAIQKVRQIKNDKALYFGPYSSGSSINRTMKQIQKIFKLRKCSDTQFKRRSRPCLNYQIKACLGVCCNEISFQEYHRTVQDAILFLRGKSGRVIKKLTTQMKTHSESLEFEKAAHVRDTILAIRKVMERQVVVSSNLGDRDTMALATGKGRAVVTVLVVRGGRLIDTASYHIDPGFKDPAETLSAFVKQYYAINVFLPPHILLDREPEDKTLLQQALTNKKGKKISLSIPARGEKKRLVDMARLNAVQVLEKRLEKEEQERAAILMLKDLLQMERSPERIECFDNSHLSGQDAVAGMVVFQNGRPFKDDYRRFIILNPESRDDYAYMHQILTRRFKKDPGQMPLPDLLVVDGGKGQLGMAMAVLKDLEIENRFMVVGLAKKNEDKKEEHDKIYIPGRSNSLNTSQSLKALYLLEQIRDEAHRFAITFQKKRRQKRSRLSALDQVPGIGPRKKQILLHHFKSVAAISSASVREIAALPGIDSSLAKKVLAGLKLK